MPAVRERMRRTIEPGSEVRPSFVDGQLNMSHVSSILPSSGHQRLRPMLYTFAFFLEWLAYR